MKNSFIIIALLNYLTISGQINHVIGIDFGFCPTGTNSVYSYPINDYKFEINALYTFKYKLLAIKIEEGIMPNTEFGNIYRTFIMTGINTSLEKTISFNALVGFGGYKFTNPTHTFPDGNTVYVSGGGPILDLGIFINPFRKKNIGLGVDSYITKMNSYVSGYHIPFSSSPLTFRVSAKYIFSKNKTKPST